MRQYMFSLRYLLDGHMEDREKQKQLCSKDHVSEADSSVSSCDHEHESIKFKHLYFHYLDGFNYTSRGGFRYVLNDPLNDATNTTRRKIFHNPNEIKAMANEAPLYALDGCSNGRHPDNDVRLCLQHFFNGSTSTGIHGCL